MATAPISPPLSSPPCGFSAGRTPATRLPSPKPPATVCGFACRCRGRPGEDAGGDRGGWAAALGGAMQRVARTWSGIFGEGGKEGDEERGEGEVGEWSWDRWRRHFDEVEEQGRLVFVLKSQLVDAVYREVYQDAAKLKVAIAAAAQNDAVGQAIFLLKKAVREERYSDAAFIRDHAGAGLVGWWAGKSEDLADPYGLIIQITAEHGKYVARSYSSRQLASAIPGLPLFEVYFTINDEGKYRHQAVYLKQNQKNPMDYLAKPQKSSAIGNFDPLNDPSEGKSELKKPGKTAEKLEDAEDRGDDSDVAEEISGFQGVLRDMIPGVKIRVLKVVGPEKLDKDFIFKSIEQDLDEESDDGNDGGDEQGEELEGSEDELNMESGRDGDSGQDNTEIEEGGSLSDAAEEGNDIAVKVVIGELLQKHSIGILDKDLVRVPAHIKKYGRQSFSLAIDVSEEQPNKHGLKGQGKSAKAGVHSHQRSIHVVMSDLVKHVVKRQQISMKILKEVGELINLTLNQAQNQQALSVSTVFSRIEIPSSSDPLNGLYVGAHGLYTSEIIHLRRRFGQWQEDDRKQRSPNFEVYEYVEAVKLTGDPCVPAGQVAFRVKVGKQNQLPHEGIIPEEFGVVARYKGQGRLAEPGFQNPRWVDGELVILDGKYIKGGPVIGFVYWAPEYHFLVFFNRLKLQD